MPLPYDLGKGIKNTHPLKDQGWDTKVFHGSTLVTAFRPSLIDAITGASRQGISSLRLGSGIADCRGTDAFQHRDILSEYLTVSACLRHSFSL